MYFEFSPTDDFYKVYQDISECVMVPFGKYILDFLEIDFELFAQMLELTETNHNGYILIQIKEKSLKQTLSTFNYEITSILSNEMQKTCQHWKDRDYLDTESIKKKYLEEIEQLQIELKKYLNSKSTCIFIPDDQPVTAYFNIEEQTGDLHTTYSIEYIHSLIYLELINLKSRNLRIRCCENCGRYFLPSKRSDEIYCNRIFKSGKTCKEVGYAEKEKKDPIKSLYTTARKTQHARIRYNAHIPDYKEKHFEPWKKAAEKARDEFQKTNDVEGFKKWLDENKDRF